MFFLEGIASEALDAMDRITRLSALRNEYHDRLQRTRASALLLKLADELFAYPAVRIASAGELLGITWRAAAMNVQKLVDAGILREVTGKERNRIFVADEILAVTQETNR